MQNWFDRKPQIKETESMRKRKGSSIARLIAVPLVFWTAFISTPQAAGVIQALVDKFRSRIDRTPRDFAQMMANTDTLNPGQSPGQDSNEKPLWNPDDLDAWGKRITRESAKLVDRAEAVANILKVRAAALHAEWMETYQIYPEQAKSISQDLERVPQIYTEYIDMEQANLQQAKEDTDYPTPGDRAQAFEARLIQIRAQSQYPFEYITSMENPQHPDKVTTYQEFVEWLNRKFPKQSPSPPEAPFLPSQPLDPDPV
jgi:hypothetical protein